MNIILLTSLVAVCGALLAWGLQKRDGIYQFPFLAGATFLSFVLPQMVGLQFDLDLPKGGLEKTFIMTILCAAMCYWGYSWQTTPLRILDWTFDERRLLQVSTIMTVVGAYFFFAISRLPEEMVNASMWSGKTVAFLFFAQVLTYGFAISVLLYFRNGSAWALAVACFGSLFYLDRIILAGRRGVALEFIFILTLGLWFGRKRLVPKSCVLACIVLGTLALYSTGDYRGITREKESLTAKNILAIPYAKNLYRLLTEGGEEMRNVVYTIEATDRTGHLDYGLFHWNTLIFTYVPAQIVGEDIKNALMVPTRDVAEEIFGFSAAHGSTVTGIVDAFRSFWYVGCFKFFFIAWAMRKVYCAALGGSVSGQLLNMLLMMPALHTITHHTQWFVTPWIHLSLFLIPGLYFSRRLPQTTNFVGAQPVQSF